MNGALIKKGAVVYDAIVGPDSLVDVNEKLTPSTMGLRSW
jgi:hypothetical protein